MRKDAARPLLKGAQETRAFKPALGTDEGHSVFLLTKLGVTAGNGISGQDAVARSLCARPGRGPHGGPPWGQGPAATPPQLPARGEARRALQANPAAPDSALARHRQAAPAPWRVARICSGRSVSCHDCGRIKPERYFPGTSQTRQNWPQWASR